MRRSSVKRNSRLLQYWLVAVVVGWSERQFLDGVEGATFDAWELGRARSEGTSVLGSSSLVGQLEY